MAGSGRTADAGEPRPQLGGLPEGGSKSVAEIPIRDGTSLYAEVRAVQGVEGWW